MIGSHKSLLGRVEGAVAGLLGSQHGPAGHVRSSLVVHNVVVVGLHSTLLREDVDVDLFWKGVLLVHLDLRLGGVLQALLLELLALGDLLLDLVHLLGGLGDLVAADDEGADTEAAQHQHHNHNDDRDHASSSNCNLSGSLIRDGDVVLIVVIGGSDDSSCLRWALQRVVSWVLNHDSTVGGGAQHWSTKHLRVTRLHNRVQVILNGS